MNDNPSTPGTTRMPDSPRYASLPVRLLLNAARKKRVRWPRMKTTAIRIIERRWIKKMSAIMQGPGDGAAYYD